MADAFDSVDFIELQQIGFKIAFTVMDFKTKEILDDPSYVQWNVYMHEATDFERNTPKKMLAYHKCTEEDYDSFF